MGKTVDTDLFSQRFPTIVCYEFGHYHGQGFAVQWVGGCFWRGGSRQVGILLMAETQCLQSVRGLGAVNCNFSEKYYTFKKVTR